MSALDEPFRFVVTVRPLGAPLRESGSYATREEAEAVAHEIAQRDLTLTTGVVPVFFPKLSASGAQALEGAAGDDWWIPPSKGLAVAASALQRQGFLSRRSVRLSAPGSSRPAHGFAYKLSPLGERFRAALGKESSPNCLAKRDACAAR